jgi:hypothetical protein
MLLHASSFPDILEDSDPWFFEFFIYFTLY